jgi:putative transposase
LSIRAIVLCSEDGKSEAVLEFQVSLLTYSITSNHVHLVAYADGPDQIAGMMQRATGELARDYNRRKSRTGAFWDGRYLLR